MGLQAKSGNKVKVYTVREELEGTLIESSEPGIILLKLKSGYNIGIKKEDISKIELIPEKIREEKIEKRKENKNLPKIDMIITGGTISSSVDYKTGAVKPLTNPEEMLKIYPEIFEVANLRRIERPFMKLSENMNSKDWQEIAKTVEKSLNDSEISGVIITHGTDTLHYTAAALSFFLGKLNKPVVLTYSQRSSDRASSDASLNLRCAARVAVSDIAEVVIVGHASNNDDFCHVLRGTRTRKLHSSRRDAFKPVNSRPIAKVYPDKIEMISRYNPRNENKVKLDNIFNDKIALIKFYPGQNPEILDYYSQRYEGIVIEMTGLGHVSVEGNNWLPALKKAIDNGLIICASAQTVFGRLNPLVYSAGREILKTGVIFLEDMNSETAFVKLGWVLAHKSWKDKIKDKMLENFSGEISERLEE